ETKWEEVNVRTLFTPRGNEIDVVVSVESIRAISERFANIAYGSFLRKKVADPVVANYKWYPDENLLKEDVSTVSVWVKLHGVPGTTFSEDDLSAIATKLGAGEKKTVKKLSQTSRGVPVGPKMAFKPQNEYRTVTKKPNSSSSGNRKKVVEPTIEVSNSNPFDVLNSVDNDVEFDTNGGTTNLINNEATSIGSSSMNIDNDGEFASNKYSYWGIMESDSEVEVVCDETANLMISTSGKDESDKGYGTNSLLEQWMDSYPDNDDYDPYDDDMKPSGKKMNVRTLFTPGAYLEEMTSRSEPMKEDVSTIPVWVKLYGVHVPAFSDDGLSAIATKLGTPLMFDSYISDMCMQSWGRSSYARVMIELRAYVELKVTIIVAMPKITREGHYTCNVCVEYG
nr:hypothetical protein [Tanacetum cinerariifolium]